MSTAEATDQIKEDVTVISDTSDERPSPEKKSKGSKFLIFGSIKLLVLLLESG
jgi:hypothetical protein